MMLARRAFRLLHGAALVVFATAAACAVSALISLALVAYCAPHLSIFSRLILTLAFAEVAARCCGVILLAFAFDVAVSAVEASFQRKG